MRNEQWENKKAQNIDQIFCLWKYLNLLFTLIKLIIYNPCRKIIIFNFKLFNLLLYLRYEKMKNFLEKFNDNKYKSF